MPRIRIQPPAHSETRRASHSGSRPAFHIRRAGQPSRIPVPAGQARGFTLIEVLVALTILAVALTAAMRAMGSMIETSSALESRMLAAWSAENHLAGLRLSNTFPEPGTRGYACPQGGQALYCEETVSGTPNPVFRRVEVAVFRSATDKSVRLAWLVTLLPNGTRNAL